MIINFPTMGRGNAWQHHDIIINLSGVFKELSFEVKFSEEAEKGNAINFLFEGFSTHPIEQTQIDEFLANDNCCFGLICTEQLIGDKRLSNKFYTFNNFIAQKLKKRNKTYKFQLISAYYFWKFRYMFLKTIRYFEQVNKIIMNEVQNFGKKKFFANIFLNPIIGIKKCISLFIFKSRLSNIFYKISEPMNEPNFKKQGKFYDFVYWSCMWKGIFMGTYQRLNKFDIAISIGIPNEFPEYYIRENISFFYLGFLLTNYSESVFKNKIKKYRKKNIKDIDFLISGRKTSYREQIINKIKKKDPSIKIVYTDLLEDESIRYDLLSRSKYVLGLKQTEKQNFISHARIFASMQCDVPVIVEGEKEMEPKYIQDFCFLESTENIEFKMSKYIQCYDQYLKIFEQQYTNYKNYSNSEITKVKNFFNKLNLF